MPGLAAIIATAVVVSLLVMLAARAPQRPRPASAAAALPDPGTTDERDAYLLIADISGYTRFMTFNALETAHAQFALNELLGALWDGPGRALEPIKTEGDAVLFAAPADRGGAPARVADGVTRLLTHYYAVRGALIRHNPCTCRACASLPDLELKLVGHRGPVLFHEFRGQADVAGLPVIVVHRLLKNPVQDRRYVAVSEAAGTLPLDFGGSRTETVAADYADVGRVVLAVHRFDPTVWEGPSPWAEAHAQTVLRDLPDAV